MVNRYFFIYCSLATAPEVLSVSLLQWCGKNVQIVLVVAGGKHPYRWYGGGSKGVINFRWIFCAMRSLVPVGHFQNLSWHLFAWLVGGSFQWRHWLLFTDCIVWDDKDKVIGFKRSHWIHFGWWSTGSPKLQLFRLWQQSHVTNCRLISSSAYFPWNMALKYKMQLSEGSWDNEKQTTF